MKKIILILIGLVPLTVFSQLNIVKLSVHALDSMGIDSVWVDSTDFANLNNLTVNLNSKLDKAALSDSLENQDTIYSTKIEAHEFHGTYNYFGNNYMTYDTDSLYYNAIGSHIWKIGGIENMRLNNTALIIKDTADQIPRIRFQRGSWQEDSYNDYEIKDSSGGLYIFRHVNGAYKPLLELKDNHILNVIKTEIYDTANEGGITKTLQLISPYLTANTAVECIFAPSNDHNNRHAAIGAKNNGSNAINLYFKTGQSSTITTKMTLDPYGNLWFGNDNTDRLYIDSVNCIYNDDGHLGINTNVLSIEGDSVFLGSTTIDTTVVANNKTTHTNTIQAPGYEIGSSSVMLTESGGILQIDGDRVVEMPDTASIIATHTYVDSFYHPVDTGSILATQYYVDQNADIASLDRDTVLSIHASSFISQAPDVMDVSITFAGFTASADVIIAICPVNLPQGVTVTKVIVYGDAAATAETYTLQRIALTDGSQSAMGTANIGTEDTSISNATIDNNTYCYCINTSSIDTGDTIYGARIIFTR